MHQSFRRFRAIQSRNSGLPRSCQAMKPRVRKLGRSVTSNVYEPFNLRHFFVLFAGSEPAAAEPIE